VAAVPIASQTRIQKKLKKKKTEVKREVSWMPHAPVGAKKGINNNNNNNPA
jgi:hypothetical protein